MIYRRDVDGLRAVAVIPVMLFHAGLPFFPGGFIGVDVFFVISGYLIGTLIQQDLQQNRFTLTRFYERRIRRILPALVTVMTACLPAAWLLMPPADLKDFAESLAAVSLFLSNLLFWSESGYFDTAAELKPLLHTWSLAVEEQFYLLFPLLLAGAHRYRRTGRWLLAVLGMASLALAQWQVTRHPDAAFYLLPARFWELLAGVLAAFVLLERPQPGTPALRQAGAAAGLLMIVSAVLLFSRDTPFPGLAALLPVAGSVLVILCAGPDNLTGRLLASRVPVGIGLISYSAYLWHQPLLAFSRFQEHAFSAELMGALLVVASLVLAWLSWRFIERPFRTPGLIATRTVMWLALAAGVVFIALCIAGHRHNGFVQQRTSELTRELLATAVKHPKTKDCSTSGWNYRKPADACVFAAGSSNSNSPQEVAVMGDSHANMLSYPLADVLNPLGFSVRQLSFGGCAPVREEAGARAPASACAAWTNETLAYLKSRPEIGTVVIAYRLHTHLYGGHVEAYPAQPNHIDPQTRERRWQAYVQLIRELDAAGKRVVVLQQVPEVRRRVHDLIFVARDPAAPIVGVSRAWWDGRRAFAQRRQHALPDSVLQIDPTGLFCDADHCYASRDGIAYYFDHNHLSATGATMLASLVADCARTQGFLPGADGNAGTARTQPAERLRCTANFIN